MRSELMKVIALVAVALFAIDVWASDSSQSQLRWTLDFEDGDAGDLIKSGNLPAIMQERSRAGDWAMKSVLDRLDSNVSYRTEFQVPAKQKFFESLWMGISIYLPADYGVSDTWEYLFQVHDTPNDWGNSRNPILAIGPRYGENQWQIVGRANSVYNGTKETQRNVFRVRVDDLNVGEWTDWVLNVRWDYRKDGNGFAKVWRNGKLVVDYRGPISYFDDRGPYVKFGIYKGWRDRVLPLDPVSRRVVYHDEYREAGPDGSYELVAPGGRGKVVTENSRPLPPLLAK